MKNKERRWTRMLRRMKRWVRARRAAALVRRSRSASRVPGAHVTRLAVDATQATNPSIARHDGRWVVGMRVPNYRIHEDGTYELLEESKGLSSGNAMLTYDDEFNVLSKHHFETYGFTSGQSLASDGLEDPRLLSRAGRLHAVWSGLTVPSTSAQSGDDGAFKPDWGSARSTMFRGEIVDGGARNIEVLPSPHGATREKNWMPFFRDEELSFIYRLYPLEVATMSRGDTGQASIVLEKSRASPRRLQGWSGSSQLIPWGRGWLCVAHFAGRILRDFAPWRRAIYVHRFVRFDEHLKVVGTSRPFVFEKLGIEFCAGLATTESRAYLSYGVDDAGARMLDVPVEWVRSQAGYDE